MQSPKVEIVIEAGDWPAKARLQRLATRAVKAAVKAVEDPSPSPSPRGGGEPELSIVFTDDAAMKRLNKAWRGKDKPTNVLSFPQRRGPLSNRWHASWRCHLGGGDCRQGGGPCREAA